MPPEVQTISSPPFYKSYLKGEFFFGFWNMVSRGIGFLNTLITLSQLSVYLYGVFQLILASYAGFSVFLGLGGGTIRNDILRYVGENKHSFAKKLFYESSLMRLAIGIILWAAVYFGASLFSSKYGSDFIYYIRIFSFLFLHDAIWPGVQQIFEVHKDFNMIASKSSISKVVQLVILGYFYFSASIGLSQIVLSLVISSYVSLIFLILIVIRRYYGFWRDLLSTDEQLLRELLFSYGRWELLQPAAAKLTNFVQVWLTKILISTEAVAIFSVAQTMIGTLGNLIPDNTLSVLIPLHVADKEKMRKIYTLGSKYMFLLAVVMSLGALVLAPPFIYIFFPKYAASLPLFSVMLVSLPISAVSILAAVFLITYRRQGFLLVQKILKGLISALLSALLVPFFGIWGLVIQGIILSIILYVIMYIYMVKTDLDLSLDWHDLFHFGQADKELLRNVYGDARKYFDKWLPDRFKTSA